MLKGQLWQRRSEYKLIDFKTMRQSEATRRQEMFRRILVMLSSREFKLEKKTFVRLTTESVVIFAVMSLLLPQVYMISVADASPVTNGGRKYHLAIVARRGKGVFSVTIVKVN